MFAIRLSPRNGGGEIYRHQSFFTVRAALLRLEQQNPVGTVELVSITTGGAAQRCCRDCGKAIAAYRARCLTCSVVPGPFFTGAASGGRGFRVRR